MIEPALHETLLELRPQLDAIADVAPGAWLGAGAIRNRVWNRVLGDGGPPDRDWDVAYTADIEGAELEARLAERLRGPWEAVDQRRYGHPSAAHGIAAWPETATAIAARRRDAVIEVLAPWGIEDLMTGVLRPTTLCPRDVFDARQAAKRWTLRWPTLEARPALEGEPDLSLIEVPIPRGPGAPSVVRCTALSHAPSTSRTTDETYGHVAHLSQPASLRHLRVHHEVLPPGRRSSRPHYHTAREEVVYVVAGQVVLTLGLDSRSLGAGELALFPPGPPTHVIHNDAEEPAELIVLSASPSHDSVIYADG